MTEKNSVVRARVEKSDKAEATAVLAAMGLTLSDAFRMLVKRIATEKARPKLPGDLDVEAFRTQGHQVRACRVAAAVELVAGLPQCLHTISSNRASR